MRFNSKTRPPAVELMHGLGLDPDPWQAELLESSHSRVLLNCCRQAGKSTVVAMLALAETVWAPGTRVVILSRSQRQSQWLFRIMVDAYRRMGEPVRKRVTETEMELENQSRVVCFPCREDTIRGFSNVSLLVIDEAARVPDHIYRAVRPMLAVSGGRLICLSTPWGKRGFFHDAWVKGGEEWHRVEIPASKVPRIMASFLEEERHNLGESFYRQEYECSFESLEGLVYPDFARCVVETVPANLQFAIPDLQFAMKHNATSEDEHSRLQIENCKLQIENLEWVGGIDFGFRNPFAAVWGVRDRDDVLWIVGEHYARQKPLSYHAGRLPREVTWYVDPAGAQEKCELRGADFCIRDGKNSLRTGIQAVTNRLANGSLKVLKGRCPNLLAEAGLYRWSEGSSDRDSEEPVDAHNHALAALRYLIATLDHGRSALTAEQREEETLSWRRKEQEWRDDEDDERFFQDGWSVRVA